MHTSSNLVRGTKLNVLDMTKKEFYETHLKGKYFNIEDPDEVDIIEEIANELGYPFWNFRYANNTESIWKAGVGSFTIDLEEASLWTVKGIFDEEFAKQKPKSTMFYVAEDCNSVSLAMNLLPYSGDYSISKCCDPINANYCDKLLVLLGDYINKTITKNTYNTIREFLKRHKMSDVIVRVDSNKGWRIKRLIGMYVISSSNNYNYATLKLR